MRRCKIIIGEAKAVFKAYCIQVFGTDKASEGFYSKV